MFVSLLVKSVRDKQTHTADWREVIPATVFIHTVASLPSLLRKILEATWDFSNFIREKNRKQFTLQTHCATIFDFIHTAFSYVVASILILSSFFSPWCSLGKYVVFFFYPLDFTFVCPTEIVAFSDRAEEFRNIGCEVIGCSVDSHFSHLAWWGFSLAGRKSRLEFNCNKWD